MKLIITIVAIIFISVGASAKKLITDEDCYKFELLSKNSFDTFLEVINERATALIH